MKNEEREEEVNEMNVALKAISIGDVKSLKQNDKIVSSAIQKSTIASANVTLLGLEGDAQADLKNHGGPDKAICAYFFDHYSYWEEKLDKSLSFSAFGENVTLQGTTEKEIRIGDIFKVNDVLMQVSQPRQPCFKLGLKHGQPQMPVWVRETGYTGFYFRVLQEGTFTMDHSFERVETNPTYPTLAQANELMYSAHPNKEAIKEIIEINELSESWKKQFKKRLNK